MTRRNFVPLRSATGLLLVAHGAHKLTTRWGGDGPRRTAAAFEGWGLRPALPAAWTAGTAQVAGGLLLASGRHTAVASALINGTLAAAVGTALRPRGFWSKDGGYEYPLVLMAVVASLAADDDARSAIAALAGSAGAGAMVAWAARRASP